MGEPERTIDRLRAENASLTRQLAEKDESLEEWKADLNSLRDALAEARQREETLNRQLTEMLSVHERLAEAERESQGHLKMWQRADLRCRELEEALDGARVDFRRLAEPAESHRPNCCESCIYIAQQALSRLDTERSTKPKLKDPNPKETADFLGGYRERSQTDHG